MEKIHPIEVFSENYWLQLHENPDPRCKMLNELRTPQNCYWWSGVALEVIESQGYKDIFESFSFREAPEGGWFSNTFGLWSHSYLKSQEHGDIFIADGTAMQFDPNYPMGYYGFINQASQILQEVYSIK